MAYLVRRLLENTSNDSFLADQARGVARRGAARRAVSLLAPFANEPVLELRRAPVRAQLADALRDARRARAAATCRSGSAGDDAHGRRHRLDRSRRARARGRAPPRRHARPRSTRRSSARAPGIATGAGAPAAERAAVLVARRRAGCASAGSSWPRSRCASARSRGRRPTPTCARRSTSSSTTRASAIELEAGEQLLQLPGERNTLRYRPRGVVAVISPWNFPVAIPCGMTAAGLATGNAVVLKPAEQAPGCAYVLVARAARGRRAAGRARAAARRGRGGRRARARPARAHDRLHGLLAGRARDRARRRPRRPPARSTSSA